MRSLAIALVLVVCAFILAPASRAQSAGANFCYSPISNLNIVGNTAVAINNKGQIAGVYADQAGNEHIFVYAGGAVTTIDPPAGSEGISVSGINDSDQMVGYLVDQEGVGHAYLYSAGTFTFIVDPNAPAGGGTYAFGINDNGVIVGGTDFDGFVDHGGTFTTIDYPGTDVSGTSLYGINDLGEIVGSYDDLQGTQAFLDNNGAFTPVGPPGAFSSTGNGINDLGEIVGFSQGTNSLGAYSAGYLENGGTVTLMDFPGTEIGSTDAYGINDSGEIAGDAYGNGYIYFRATGPGACLIDPVPSALNGAAVDPNALANAPPLPKVSGVAADGVTQVVVEIPTQNAGDQITLTLMNDQGQQSSDPAADGALGNPGDSTFSQSQITVTAQSTSTNPAAFAIYRAPLDFVRSPSPGTYMSGTCNGVTKTDDQLACRMVSIQAQLPGGQVVTQPITILRPPVVLVHGLWGDSSDWTNFAPLFEKHVADCESSANCLKRFSVTAVDLSDLVGGAIVSSVPTYSAKEISGVRANSLGFLYNATPVMVQIQNAIDSFKGGGNPLGIQAAAVQADIVAHSMGGDIVRTLPLLGNFLADTTFGQGNVHKLITIDTPHLGTPVAGQFLQDDNSCVRNILADHGHFAFSSVSSFVLNGGNISGAVGDLQGDGYGGALSQALQNIQNPGSHAIPTALIYGVAEQSNLDRLSTSAVSVVIHSFYGVAQQNPLGKALTSSNWAGVFTVVPYAPQPSDGIVPLASELDGKASSSGLEADGFVHSGGLERLGFTGPSMLPTSSDEATPAFLDELVTVPNYVIQLLNTPVSDPKYQSLNP